MAPSSSSIRTGVTSALCVRNAPRPKWVVDAPWPSLRTSGYSNAYADKPPLRQAAQSSASGPASSIDSHTFRGGKDAEPVTSARGRIHSIFAAQLQSRILKPGNANARDKAEFKSFAALARPRVRGLEALRLKSQVLRDLLAMDRNVQVHP